MRLLDLLKRIEFVGCNGGCQSTGPCPECGNDRWEKHKPDCELKAAINDLEAKQARINRMEPELKAFFNPVDFEGAK